MKKIPSLRWEGISWNVRGVVARTRDAFAKTDSLGQLWDKCAQLVADSDAAPAEQVAAPKKAATKKK